MKCRAGSRGLVVMGGDCPEGCAFESQHRTLDVHLFTYICVKNVVFV